MKHILKPIKVKLVTENGETVTHKDGSPMTFILVDEAELKKRNAESYGEYYLIREILGRNKNDLSLW